MVIGKDRSGFQARLSRSQDLRCPIILFEWASRQDVGVCWPYEILAVTDFRHRQTLHHHQLSIKVDIAESESTSRVHSHLEAVDRCRRYMELRNEELNHASQVMRFRSADLAILIFCFNTITEVDEYSLSKTSTNKNTT
jgi:hypothetical protein